MMQLNYTLKKTTELSEQEKDEIRFLFREVFNKKKSIESFNRQFCSTPTSWSLHGLLTDNGKIVGCYTAVPVKYRFFGEEHLFALSVDTMIKRQYRGDPFKIMKMAQLVYEGLAKEGISFIYGFPKNDKVMTLLEKLLKWKKIGALEFYVLPINIDVVKPSLGCLKWPVKAFTEVLTLLCNLFISKKFRHLDFNIEKVNDDSFIQYRYDNEYVLIKTKSYGYFCFRIWNEDGIKTAYIIDVFPLNRNNLETAVNYIYKNYKNSADLIMYVGKLDFAPRNLFKVPAKYNPKKVNMGGRILSVKGVDDRIFDSTNWHVNLSDFDVR